MKKTVIVAAAVSFALLLLCGCSDLASNLVIDKKVDGEPTEIGALTIVIPEGYWTYEKYQKSDSYGGIYTEDNFENWVEPRGVKPEYKYFININSGSLSTNWFAQDYGEDELWDGMMDYAQSMEPREVTYEELDIEGLEDVRLQCFITDNTSFHMEGDKKAYEEEDFAIAAFTYEGQVYILELREGDTHAKKTTLQETRQRMVDILESISTQSAEE